MNTTTLTLKIQMRDRQRDIQIYRYGQQHNIQYTLSYISYRELSYRMLLHKMQFVHVVKCNVLVCMLNKEKLNKNC